MQMETGYEEVREELKEWNFDELLFGLKWELSLAGKRNFDKKLILVYLDAIKKTLPLRPFSKTYIS